MASKADLEALIEDLEERVSDLEDDVAYYTPNSDLLPQGEESIVLATKTDPYPLANAVTLYVSGDTLLDVAKALLGAMSDLGGVATFLTLSVDFIPAGDDGEPSYFAGTLTTGE